VEVASDVAVVVVIVGILGPDRVENIFVAVDSAVCLFYERLKGTHDFCVARFSLRPVRYVALITVAVVVVDGAVQDVVSCCCCSCYCCVVVVLLLLLLFAVAVVVAGVDDDVVAFVVCRCRCR